MKCLHVSPSDFWESHVVCLTCLGTLSSFSSFLCKLLGVRLCQSLLFLQFEGRHCSPTRSLWVPVGAEPRLHPLMRFHEKLSVVEEEHNIECPWQPCTQPSLACSRADLDQCGQKPDVLLQAAFLLLRPWRLSSDRISTLYHPSLSLQVSFQRLQNVASGILNPFIIFSESSWWPAFRYGYK